tara:strand:- start:319 stop:519 length:201 start_codon:yes stop_codon:yes gene_type:complete
MNEIHSQLFESMHNTQMTSINESIIKDARKVILRLLTQVSGDHRNDMPGKDNAILGALEWLKNNQL